MAFRMPTYLTPSRNKGLIACLIKVNQWPMNETGLNKVFFLGGVRWGGLVDQPQKPEKGPPRDGSLKRCFRRTPLPRLRLPRWSCACAATQGAGNGKVCLTKKGGEIS